MANRRDSYRTVIDWGKTHSTVHDKGRNTTDWPHCPTQEWPHVGIPCPRWNRKKSESKKAFPAGFVRLPHVKHEVRRHVFPEEQIHQFLGWSSSMLISICLLAFCRVSSIFLTTHPELGDVSPGRSLERGEF